MGLQSSPEDTRRLINFHFGANPKIGDHLKTMTSSSTLQEIVDLFAKLASHFQNPNSSINDEQEEAIDLSISKLNRSLNVDGESSSSIRVLDTALSLMCFKAPQVFDSVVEYSVKTIVSVLSGSISCKVLRFRSAEVLQVGGSISCCDSVNLIEACGDIIGKLEGHGMPYHLLLHAVLRVAVSASCCRHLSPLLTVVDPEQIDGRSTTVTNLLCYLPREISLQTHQIPLRLLFWYLDPRTLKNDVSKILQDTLERPFLHLKNELHERTNRRSIVICLALSPIMFIETRTLLHNWFLRTGLASVLEFLVQLVSVILDVLSRPTWWGVPMELGSKLPFSNAYFPHNSSLLRTLAGPLLNENFIHLVEAIDKPGNSARERVDQTSKAAAMDVATIYHKSIWALAMNFPDWFYFASVLLFSEESFLDKCHSHCTPQATKFAHSNNAQQHSCRAIAARYIAWLVNPASKSHQDFLVVSLTKLSESWILKQLSSGRHAKEYMKKLKKAKACDDEGNVLSKETVVVWLKEFQNISATNWNKSINIFSSEAKSSYCLNLHQNVLVRRISLGILIGGSDCVTEYGCELLLHYVVTGRIHETRESKSNLKSNVKWNSKVPNSITWDDDYNENEAVSGVYLVFTLTDSIESMSDSLFETEENVLDLISRVKVRSLSYLIKCIKKLLHLTINEVGKLMLVDLTSRLDRWRHQGQEIFLGHKELNDISNTLTHKLSLS